MKLTIDTICLLSSIIDKVEIDDSFINEMMKAGKTAKGKSKAEAEAIQEQIGIKVFLKLGKKIHNVKDELIEFVALYKEISKEEAQKIDLMTIFKELSKDEGLLSFFKSKAIQV